MVHINEREAVFNALQYDVDNLRTRFSLALSDMYKEEVPLYGTLIDIVSSVDDKVLRDQGHDHSQLPGRHEIERHGAIRLGTEDELHSIRRLFAVLGMHPVGYYDLSVVGFPLHATAFRPVTPQSLNRNPFRVFTTVLRKEFLSSSTREKAERILARRNLFTSRLLEIIERIETSKTLDSHESGEFIDNALKIFKWHSKSVVSMGEYLHLKSEHPMIADIVCFPSAHINHLTPRTLDIDLVQREMQRQGLPAKESIEGPPRRRCPILLRQTSFRALEEHVVFTSEDGNICDGTHTARFGEVEQRGAAVTPKGRELYNQLMKMGRDIASKSINQGLSEDSLSRIFASHYPDSWDELRRQKLVYFKYEPVNLSSHFTDVASSPTVRPEIDIERLITSRKVQYEPIVYEDFLPFSAAGIFMSNLGSESEKPASRTTSPENKDDMESALKCKILDEFKLYEQLQRESIEICEQVLNIRIIGID